MILEVVEPRTGVVRIRLRLGSTQLTVGRAPGNDLVLDDPYVDARHAHITLDDTGALVLQDLGSLNGLSLPDTRTPVTRVSVYPGLEVRVGRTTLRFRDPQELVPPALPDIPDPTQSASIVGRALASLWARIALPLVATGAVSGYAWLHSFESSGGSDTFAGAFAFLMMSATWAGIWAIASRIVVHRFHFFEHLALTSAAALITITWIIGGEWITFLFPDNIIQEPISVVLGLALIAALVAGHLALSSTMTHARRWRAGVVTSGILIALAGLAALAERESFSDVPQFSGVLKPFRTDWLPARTVEDFRRATANLKKEVDKIATEE